MSEQDTLNQLLGRIQQQQQNQQLALMILQEMTHKYREYEDLAGLLFSLRDVLNTLLRDVPIERGEPR